MAKPPKEPDDQKPRPSEDEVLRRMLTTPPKPSEDEVLRRMLTTPPKPHKHVPKRKKKGDSRRPK